MKAHTGPPPALEWRPRAALSGREQRPVRVVLFVVVASLGVVRGEARGRDVRARRVASVLVGMVGILADCTVVFGGEVVSSL